MGPSSVLPSFERAAASWLAATIAAFTCSSYEASGVKQGLQRSTPASWPGSSRWQSCSHGVPVAAGGMVGEPKPALAAEVLGPQLDCHGVDRLQPVEDTSEWLVHQEWGRDFGCGHVHGGAFTGEVGVGHTEALALGRVVGLLGSSSRGRACRRSGAAGRELERGAPRQPGDEILAEEGCLWELPVRQESSRSSCGASATKSSK
jgi:hypothetical protein